MKAQKILVAMLAVLGVQIYFPVVQLSQTASSASPGRSGTVWRTASSNAEQGQRREIRVPPLPFVDRPMPRGNWTLVGWNDLGMHCMDGNDFSVFSILPPYNTIHAQLISSAGRLVASDAGIAVSYEAMYDPDLSANSVSSTKTNFWSYVLPLFGVGSCPGQRVVRLCHAWCGQYTLKHEIRLLQPLVFGRRDSHDCI